jgi:hypothetical protein
LSSIHAVMGVRKHKFGTLFKNKISSNTFY